MRTYVTNKTEILVVGGEIEFYIELTMGKVNKKPKIVDYATKREIYISLDRLRELPDSINEFLRIVDAELGDESYFVDGINNIGNAEEDKSKGEIRVKPDVKLKKPKLTTVINNVVYKEEKE